MRPRVSARSRAWASGLRVDRNRESSGWDILFIASLAKCALPASDPHARDLGLLVTRNDALARRRQLGVRASTHKRPVRGPLSGANRKTFGRSEHYWF